VKLRHLVWLLPSVALAGAEDISSVCPELPHLSSVVWSASRGPDFHLCYAVDAKSEEDVFGIYLGYAPDMHRDPSLQITTGRVGGMDVIWYRVEESRNLGVYGRETLVDLKPHGSKAHIWLAASTEAELKRGLSILENIRFKRQRAP
jgi:hypothetical protein